MVMRRGLIVGEVANPVMISIGGLLLRRGPGGMDFLAGLRGC